MPDNIIIKPSINVIPIQYKNESDDEKEITTHEKLEGPMKTGYAMNFKHQTDKLIEDVSKVSFWSYNFL